MDGGGLNGARKTSGGIIGLKRALIIAGVFQLAGCAHFSGWGSGSSGDGARGGAAVSIPFGK